MDCLSVLLFLSRHPIDLALGVITGGVVLSAVIAPKWFFSELLRLAHGLVLLVWAIILEIFWFLLRGVLVYGEAFGLEKLIDRLGGS